MLQLYGVPLGLDHPTVHELLKMGHMLNNALKINGECAETDSFPWLLNVPFLNRRYKAHDERIRCFKERLIGSRIKEYMVCYFSLSNFSFTRQPAVNIGRIGEYAIAV